VKKPFVHPYELYTWGEIYTIITSALIGLCVNMKVTKTIQKLSKIPDSRYEKYGMTLDDPLKKTKRENKSMRQRFQKYEKNKARSYQKDTRERSHYKKYTKSRYYSPEDIKLQYFKQQSKANLTCWLCGQPRNLVKRCP
jgi:hypothetical protein